MISKIYSQKAYARCYNGREREEKEPEKGRKGDEKKKCDIFSAKEKVNASRVSKGKQTTKETLFFHARIALQILCKF